MKQFRHMRLSDNQVSDAEAGKMLEEALHGTLAIQTKEGYPITIPINFVYKDNKILFHGAKAGQKYELIQEEPMGSFCVIAEDDIRPEFITSLYASTIAFGTIKEVKDDDARMDCLMSILEKYVPTVMEKGKQYIKDSWDSVACFELDIEYMTGKIGTE
ncbi:MAG: pyridoxamine 5'-phosphate oxidase family protein [Eubacteriales bacterium]|nr:pyridoxamine 5'-phosphate oxidase family protein [Eubacteriales bacterium]